MNGLQEQVSAKSRPRISGAPSRVQGAHADPRPARSRARGLLLALLVFAAGVVFTEMRDAGSNNGLAAQHIYVVKPGDTLWSIAAKYAGNGNVSSLEYRLYSELGTTRIYPGETVRVP